jgi:Actinobacteria/chloroflexi VLRF1 release factor
VQGTTAAGGWSQQRFARRRENQAQALLAAAIAAATTRLVGDLDGLIIGGDRALLDLALADPRLRQVAALPRSPLLAIADPGAAVLAAAGARGRAIRIRLDQDEAGPAAQPG